MQIYKNGDRLIHVVSGKKCTFKEYECEGQCSPDDCAWVVFDRIWFRKNQERLVYVGNLTYKNKSRFKRRD